MTATLHADTIQKASGDPVELTGQSAAKAWSNLNGTGTIAERDSFNISGYTDYGTGEYGYSISNDMSDANYEGCTSGTRDEGAYVCFTSIQNDRPPTVGTFSVTGSATNNAVVDNSYCTISLHGDLA